ncbi:MAG: hypothetical protein AAF747_07425 [Planctomycetota bacterium]
MIRSRLFKRPAFEFVAERPAIRRLRACTAWERLAKLQGVSDEFVSDHFQRLRLGWLSGLIKLAVIVVTVPPAMGIGVAFGMLFIDRGYEMSPFLIAILIASSCCVVAPLLCARAIAIFGMDWIEFLIYRKPVRRRVEHRNCTKCLYELRSAVVDDAGMVLCPECGVRIAATTIGLKAAGDG